ncbi:MAG: hypothetical protein AAB438_02340 [Patescibacteria group bacterium]
MEKIKLFIESEKGKDIMVILIVILVGLGSFGLGRLSKNDENKGIKIEYKGQSGNSLKGSENAVLGSNLSNSSLTFSPQELLVANPNLSTEESLSNMKQYFASKRGKKYYPTGCSAGKSIKAENRVYFDTSEQAEKAGYSLSTSC